MFKQANGQSSDAIQVLNEAESIATNTDYLLNLIDLFTVFSSVYSDLKDFKKVAEYQKKYINLKDSVYSKELIKNLAKVQTNFAERENIKTIKEKNEVLVLKDKLLKKQRELSAVIVAVTLIVLTFAFVLIIFQRKYSKQLKEVNLKLEEKVLERTQDLKKTNEKLDRAQGDLRNFLYKTSHDIRGPVATLKGLNNLGFDNINDHVFSKELLEKKSTQIEKMIRTLSRITVVADITNTILQAVEINFVKMMDEIKDFERKNGLLKYIKISIEVEPNLKVVSDPILIRMILENMVDNSLKFFNESKRIEPYVKISVKSAGSDAMIMVEDNGVGIEVKPNQDVFTMFMRGSEKSETGGVGLYLCKICTDRLQGSIKLEKTSKAGTIFSIRISQDATDQVMELNEALLAQLRKEEPPIIEFDQETNN
jgi:signal transduction histidine kinase